MILAFELQTEDMAHGLVEALYWIAKMFNVTACVGRKGRRVVMMVLSGGGKVVGALKGTGWDGHLVKAGKEDREGIMMVMALEALKKGGEGVKVELN